MLATRRSLRPASHRQLSTDHRGYLLLERKTSREQTHFLLFRQSTVIFGRIGFAKINGPLWLSKSLAWQSSSAIFSEKIAGRGTHCLHCWWNHQAISIFSPLYLTLSTLTPCDCALKLIQSAHLYPGALTRSPSIRIHKDPYEEIDPGRRGLMTNSHDLTPVIHICRLHTLMSDSDGLFEAGSRHLVPV